MAEQDRNATPTDKAKAHAGASAARTRGIGAALAAGAARARAAKQAGGEVPEASSASAFVTTAIVAALLIGTLAMMLIFAK